MDPIFQSVESDEIAARDKITGAFSRLNEKAASNPGLVSVMGGKTTINIRFGQENAWNSNGYMVINPDSIDDIQKTDSFDSDPNLEGLNRSLDRLLFHEAFHAVTTPTATDRAAFQMPQEPGVNFAEAAAIFAENLIFAPAYGEGSRAGHVLLNYPTDAGNFSDMSGVGNVSGLAAFNWFGSPQDAVVHRSGDGIVFSKVSADGAIGVFKTYHESNQAFGGQISLLAQNSAGFVNVSAAGANTGAGWADVTSSIMGGSTASSALNALTSTLSAYSWLGSWSGSRGQILGVGADTFYDRKPGLSNLPLEDVRTYVFSGVGYRVLNGHGEEVDRWSPPVIEVSAENSSHNVVLIGASASATTRLSKDDLKGGSGNDILISGNLSGGNSLDGGAGNDILIGTNIGSDELTGGSGNDLFIARGTSSTYHGGGDGGDVLSYHLFGDGIEVDLALGLMRHPLGNDAFDGIAKIVGTQKVDHFLLGDNVELYGGGGSDVFIGTPNASIDGGIGTDTLKLGENGGTINLATGLLKSIERIEGSGAQDNILGGYSLDGTAITIETMGGNDYIESQAGTLVRAGTGNDVIKLIGVGYGSVDGGADVDTVYFTNGGRNTYDMRAGTYDQYDYSSNHIATMSVTNMETVYLSNGINTVYGKDGGAVIVGGGLLDVIYGGSGVDYIYANGFRTQDDGIHGGGGNDFIYGTGYDNLYGDGGSDTIFGGANNDYIYGGADPDELHGGDGNDIIHPGFGGGNVVFGDGGDQDMIWFDFTYENDPYTDSSRLLSIREGAGGWEITTEQGGVTYVDTAIDIEYAMFAGQGWQLTPGFEWFI